MEKEFRNFVPFGFESVASRPGPDRGTEGETEGHSRSSPRVPNVCRSLPLVSLRNYRVRGDD